MKPGWTRVSLGDICELKYGKALAANVRVPGEVPVFGSNGQVGTHCSAVTSGPTIVVGRKGSFGLVNYSEVGCWPIDTTYYIDGTATEQDLRWLHHVLPSLHLTELNRAAAVPGLNREDAYRRELLLPPIEEQRRIAAILDHADQLVQIRQKTLGEANRLLNGAVHRALAASGTSVPLKELADVRIGPFGSLLHREDYVEGGVPLINPMHIVAGTLQADPAYSVSDDKAAQLDRYRLREGDVVMGRRGEMGRCARVLDSHDGFLCGTGSLIIRPRPGRSRSTYLQCVLSAPRTVRSLESRALGMTLPNLNSKIMEELPIPNLPLDDQRDLEARVEQIDSLKAVMTVQATALSRMFTSLQARAFSGRL